MNVKYSGTKIFRNENIQERKYSGTKIFRNENIRSLPYGNMFYGEGRKKLRLQGFDYGNQGYYFVTICTKGRIHYFGEIKEGKVELNDFGCIAQNCWENILVHYQGIYLDEFIIMPNHIHGIIIVGNEYFRSDISNIVKGFKIGVTKEIRQNYGDYEFSWQKSFFDVIIRNDDQLQKTREYIVNNPAKWEEDVNNPKNFK